MRSRRIREDCIVSNIVVYDPAYVEGSGIKSGKNLRWTGSQIAQDSNHSYTQNVIPEPAPVWPATRYGSVTETWLNCAFKGVAAENTEPVKHWIVRIARQTCGAS